MTPVDPADSVSPRLVQFDSFTLDLARRVLCRRGERIHLTAKPLDTLVALVSRPGETVPKHELMELVWKDTAVTEDVLVQAIGEIRRALGEKKGEDRFVQTVPRQGYRFVMPVSLATAEDTGAAPDPGPAPTAPALSTLWLLPLSLVVLGGTRWDGLVRGVATGRDQQRPGIGPTRRRIAVNRLRPSRQRVFLCNDSCRRSCCESRW